MFDGFETTQIKTSGATIHLRHGGEGPPLLLLHGNPLSHVSWHLLANRLAKHFTVVATDLRGYGDSEGPEEAGPSHINYSFRAMAQDQVEVMEQLGFKQFYVAGHDRGARTTHRMCLDHPDKVLKAALLDILPSRYVWVEGPKEWLISAWHWTFMAQPYDMPEKMMASVPAEWFMKKKLKTGDGVGVFHPDAFAEYVRCFTWKTIRASCEDYRACRTIDLEHDTEDKDRKVPMPLLVLWGKTSNTGTTHDDLLPIWQKRAQLSVVGEALNCGHYVPEEAPDAVYDWFMRFFPA